MNFDRLDSRLDRKRLQAETAANTELILKASRKPRIQEKNFEEVFGAEEVARDLAMLHRVEEKFKEQLEHLSRTEADNVRQGEKLGHVLEVIISEAGEEYKWAGENAHFIRTSRFDDVINGVDLIIEFQPEEDRPDDATPHRVALAVDATRNNDTSIIRQKVQRNIEKLMRVQGRRAPEVKYYQSPTNPNVRGPLETVIPVVIGLQDRNANELINLIAPLKNFPALLAKHPNLADNIRAKEEEIAAQLLEHPAQAIFYRQIRAQLQHYLIQLEGREDHDSNNYRAEILAILDKFNTIRTVKGKLPLGRFADDEVLKAIENLTAAK